MTQTQSSLLGGENTPLHESGGTGFGALPQKDNIVTPNPLATPLRTGNVSATPRPGSTPLRTPRDSLALNQNYEVDDEKIAIQNLRRGLASLPKPKNDFELVLPDDAEEEDVMDVELSAEDAEERDRQLAQAQEAERQAALNRRSQVLQRELPRPRKVNAKPILEGFGENSVQKLIAEEMTLLIQHDASRYPLSESIPTTAPVGFPEFAAEQMAIARAEIAQELNGSSTEIQSEVWQNFDTTDIDSIPASVVEVKLTKSAPTANKLEKKLSLTLGGYGSRRGMLSGKVSEVTDAIEQARIDLTVYRALQMGEQITAPLRVEVLSSGIQIH
jgi:pre-mRNA-splicing factor CDC5/CEF1